MKRKGNVVASRTCSVVRDLPQEPNDSSSSSNSRLLSPEIEKEDDHYLLTSRMEALSTSESQLSPLPSSRSHSARSARDNNNKNDNNAPPFVSWEQTRNEMKRFVTPDSKTGVSPCEQQTSECIALLEQCSKTLHHLKITAPAQLTTQADAIESSLRQEIEAESNLVKEENGLVAEAQHDLGQLQKELETAKQHLKNLQQQKIDALQQIKNFKAEAAEDLGQFDELEASMIQRVPRMKKGIALFARCTGIKWNYDNLDVLAGEVTDQGTHTVRQFSIDPEDLDDFEIANKIWDSVA